MHCRQSPRAPRSCCPSIFLNRTPVTQVRGPRIWAGWRSHLRKAQTTPGGCFLQPLQFVPARCQAATHSSRVSALWACWAQPAGAPVWGGSRPDRCFPPQPPRGQLPATSPSPGGASRGLHRHLSPSSMGLSFPALLGPRYPRWPSSQPRCGRQE